MSRLPLEVSDHAVVRWMERYHGLDLRDTRRRIVEKVTRSVDLAERLDAHGNVTVVLDGVRYVVRDHKVVTILPALVR